MVTFDSVVWDSQSAFNNPFGAPHGIWGGSTACHNYTGPQDGLQNAIRSPERLKLDAAQAIAADVRARRPEMQVRKLEVIYD